MLDGDALEFNRRRVSSELESIQPVVGRNVSACVSRGIITVTKSRSGARASPHPAIKNDCTEAQAEDEECE
jgi:hypothetical protein